MKSKPKNSINRALHIHNLHQFKKELSKRMREQGALWEGDLPPLGVVFVCIIL
jgi:hypothetical protein